MVSPLTMEWRRVPDKGDTIMAINTEKIDNTVLALLQLTLHDSYRAWKGLDWDVLNRLHEAGYIDNPVNKTKSIGLTQEGLARSEQLFQELFVIDEDQ